MPDVAPGQTAALQVRAWEANWASYEEAVAGGGFYGRSEVLHISLGGSSTDVAVLRGLNSFCLVPEPSTWVLGLLGFAVLVWNRWRR